MQVMTTSMLVRQLKHVPQLEVCPVCDLYIYIYILLFRMNSLSSLQPRILEIKVVSVFMQYNYTYVIESSTLCIAD